MVKIPIQKKLLFKKSQGLTMIEIALFVFSITVLIIALSFTYSYTRKKSRDEKRKSDIRLIMNALEIKYNENLRYPDEIPNFQTQITPGLTILQPQLNTIPAGFEGRNYFWYTDNNKQKFCVYFQLELNNKWYSCMPNSCRVSDKPCEDF